MAIFKAGHRFSFLIVSLAMYAFTALASAATPTNPEPIIDATIQQFMENADIPGVAVALYYNGQSYFYNYGVANEETQQEINQRTIFEIGSVTKVFTATLLAEEVNNGMMSLNDPVVKYLPATASQGNGAINQVTLRELATHTSSLPSTPPGLSLADRPDFTEADLMNYIANWQPAVAIGSTYQYSNIGFGILGDALEGATHQTYAQLLQTNILNPLNMVDTRLNSATDQTRYAQGYNARGMPAMRWPLNAWPAGGALRSTSTDMLAFLKANLGINADAANSSLMTNMQFAQRGLVKTPTFMQGMAWIQSNKICTSLIIKEGGTAGFSSIIELAPDKKMGIVILANKGGAQVRPGNPAMQILASLAGCPSSNNE